MSDRIRLQVFTDFGCPWCYLCTPRVARLERSLNVDVQWVYFPLHPDTPAEGLLLKDLFAGRNFDIEAAQSHLKTLLEAEGLQFHSRTHTYNSRLAQELAKAFDSLRDALYSAYFKDSRNIGDIEVLVDVASANGIPADQARHVLTERTQKSAVDADWALARSYGITGVPSFVAGGRKVVGAQPYSTLEKLIAMAS
jgi:predicted DsbA family dithiol-disulfide isomerase